MISGFARLGLTLAGVVQYGSKYKNPENKPLHAI